MWEFEFEAQSVQFPTFFWRKNSAQAVFRGERSCHPGRCQFPDHHHQKGIYSPPFSLTTTSRAIERRRKYMRRFLRLVSLLTDAGGGSSQSRGGDESGNFPLSRKCCLLSRVQFRKDLSRERRKADRPFYLRELSVSTLNANNS